MWENQHYCLLGTSGMLESRPCPILIFYMTWYQYTGNLNPQTRIRVIVLSTLFISFTFSISLLCSDLNLPIMLLLAEEKKKGFRTLGVCSKISIRGVGGSCHCFRKGKTEKSFARQLCTFKKLPVLGVVVGGNLRADVVWCSSFHPGESSLPLFVFSETLPVITAVPFRHKPRFRALCIYI